MSAAHTPARKLVLDPRRAGVLYLQYHGGVFMSADDGETWTRLPGQFPRITSVRARVPAG